MAVVDGTDFQRGKLATGELVTVENHRNDLFHLEYDYDYARTDDRLACFALDVLEVSGAGDRSAEQQHRALYALGVTASVSCDRDRSSISLAGIDRNLEPALALVHDWIALCSPKFQQYVITHFLLYFVQLRIAMVNSLPPSCSAVTANGVTYQKCGSTYYQPQFSGGNTTYVVVNAP